MVVPKNTKSGGNQGAGKGTVRKPQVLKQTPTPYEQIWRLILKEKRKSKEKRVKITESLLGTYNNPLTKLNLNEVFVALNIKGGSFLHKCFNLQVFLKMPTEDSPDGCDGILGPITFGYLEKYLAVHKPLLLAKIKKKYQVRRTRTQQHVLKDYIRNGKGRGITYDVNPESLKQSQLEMNKACREVVDIINGTGTKAEKKRRIESLIGNYENRSTVREAIVNIPGIPKKVKFRFRLGLICYASSKWAEKYSGYRLQYWCSVRDYKWQLRLWRASYNTRKERYLAFLMGGGTPLAVMRKHKMPSHYRKLFRRGGYSKYQALKLIKRLTRRYCAYPGGSNHQSGHATDFVVQKLLANGKWKKLNLPSNANNKSLGHRKLMAILKTFNVRGKWKSYSAEDWHVSYYPHNGKWAKV